jgi:hypothetical protein
MDLLADAVVAWVHLELQHPVLEIKDMLVDMEQTGQIWEH